MSRRIVTRLVERPAADEFPGRDAALHDMANLIDAALRSVGSARRAGPSDRCLLALEAALAQMGDLMSVLAPPPRARMARDAHLSIYDAAHHAAELMRAAAAEQGVELHVEMSEDLRPVAAPGLFRVLTDCIRNSLESIALAAPTAGNETPTGAIVLLGTSSAGFVRLSIADNGPGFPPTSAGHPSAPRSPDPFVIGATTKPGSGGLGLAVARHIVARLRGAITIEDAADSSCAPGRRGALVRVQLPIDSLPASPARTCK
jgi:signal transduction histidine kinase